MIKNTIGKLIILALVLAMLGLLAFKTDRTGVSEMKYSPLDTLYKVLMMNGVDSSMMKLNIVRDSVVTGAQADSIKCEILETAYEQLQAEVDDALYLSKMWAELAYKAASLGERNKYRDYITKADSFTVVANDTEDKMHTARYKYDNYVTGRYGDNSHLIEYNITTRERSEPDTIGVGRAILGSQYQIIKY